jgi:Domain of unknown function (DUF4326)
LFLKSDKPDRDLKLTTRIVNVRDYKPYSKYWTNPPTNPYVYIGRNVRSQIPFKSKWYNPFTIEKDNNGKEVPGSRDKVIRQYQEYILNKPELLKLIPIELKNKTLGCWCKPEPCHGDILVELADK